VSLYAIGDLHLSGAADKPMDIFGEVWKEHTKKLKEGFSTLRDGDTTVLCGDISWAMSLEQALEDFRFIDSLPGKKYVLKGNHDYWFVTAAKLNAFFAKNGIGSISLLHNNCGFYGDTALCGTKGWFYEESGSGEHNEKIFRRELGRLETSLKAAGSAEKLCFLHYPPRFDSYVCHEIIDLMQRYGVRGCYYGHLHGRSANLAFSGEDRGIEYRLVSADSLGFKPFKIL
jgi:predicted phosphohydrolase